MRILLTAFEPFDGSAINPALEAVNLIPQKINDISVIKITVPTVFEKSIATVTKAIDEYQPDTVLCVGQAGGRFGITVERLAININDARIKDNEGNQPIDTVIFSDGAPAYFSNLPIKAIVAKIQEAGLPASVSNTAGTFVCNHLMYGVLYHLSKHHPQIRGGFIHVPFAHSQTAHSATPAPSMSVADIAQGLEAAIQAINES